jgi:2-polyprenyl-3-methyl-5-hydroxy-6-metoxy-1,4-benzoquinol methylase
LNGGYDEGYRKCPCFWGREPGSLVNRLAYYLPDAKGLNILDAGCGEGKNAVYFGQQGANVRAVDVSELAIRNARSAWSDVGQIAWEVSDVRNLHLDDQAYDVIIAYGLLHCLESVEEISNIVYRLKRATKIGGYNIICAFNNRSQDLSAHENFHPCLVPHTQFLALYSDWRVLDDSDTDLTEKHPHNNIEHTHSMTRLIVQNRR